MILQATGREVHEVVAGVKALLQGPLGGAVALDLLGFVWNTPGTCGFGRGMSKTESLLVRIQRLGFCFDFGIPVKERMQGFNRKFPPRELG